MLYVKTLFLCIHVRNTSVVRNPARRSRAYGRSVHFCRVTGILLLRSEAQPSVRYICNTAQQKKPTDHLDRYSYNKFYIYFFTKRIYIKSFVILLCKLTVESSAQREPPLCNPLIFPSNILCTKYKPYYHPLRKKILN